MQNKTFWYSVITTWFLLFLTDWLFHGVWMAPVYQSTQQFWRSQEEAQSMMHWALIGNFIFAWTFVWIFNQGLSKANPWHQAFRYSLAIVFIAKAPSVMIQWTYSAYPFELLAKWLIAFTVQALICAYAVTWFYKPKMAWNGSHQSPKA